MKTKLTGTYFQGPTAVQLVKVLETGEYLELEREPNNEFDSNCIKVILDGLCLGYVAKGDNSNLAEEMDKGKNFVAIYEGNKNLKIVEDDTTEIDIDFDLDLEDFDDEEIIKQIYVEHEDNI